MSLLISNQPYGFLVFGQLNGWPQHCMLEVMFASGWLRCTQTDGFPRVVAAKMSSS